MKIIVLANLDMHLEPVKYMRQDIIDSDLVVLIGNLTHQGDWLHCKKIIEILVQLNPNILAIPGSQDDASVVTYLESISKSIHGKGMILDHIGVFGVGAGNRSLFRRRFEISETAMIKGLENGLETVRDCEFLMLVCFTPPYNTHLDETVQDFHVGSRAIRSFIFRHPPDIFISSPIQTTAQVDRLGPTRLVSPPSFRDGNYLIVDTKAEELYTFRNAFEDHNISNELKLRF